MIKGMTGYGSSAIKLGDAKAVLEIKSVNHRYLDLSFYLPIGFGSVEQRIRQAVSRMFQRGRVTVSLKIIEKPEQKIVLHKPAVKRYLTLTRSMKKDFHLQDNLTMRDVIHLPGVFEARDVLVNPEKEWPSIERSLNRAMRAMEKMRKSEGHSLAKDVRDVMRRMSLRLNKIQSRCSSILREKRKHADDDEFSSFQKSMDINEELSRLKHYIHEFRILLRGTTPAGKRMDFIAQEMQRETNTIGSKVHDNVVSNCVIALKSKIEKLREQAQNVE